MQVSSGKLVYYEKFKSTFIDARNVAIWLPQKYSNQNKYADLYMHNGQMLFDALTKWNKTVGKQMLLWENFWQKIELKIQLQLTFRTIMIL